MNHKEATHGVLNGEKVEKLLLSLMSWLTVATCHQRHHAGAASTSVQVWKAKGGGGFKDELKVIGLRRA